MEIDAKNISFSYKLNKKKILTYKVHSFYQVLWKIKYAIIETMEKNSKKITNNIGPLNKLFIKFQW